MSCCVWALWQTRPLYISALPNIKAAFMRWLAPSNSACLPCWTITVDHGQVRLSAPREVPHFENSMLVVNIMLRLSWQLDTTWKSSCALSMSSGTYPTSSSITWSFSLCPLASPRVRARVVSSKGPARARRRFRSAPPFSPSCTRGRQLSRGGSSRGPSDRGTRSPAGSRRKCWCKGDALAPV